MLIQCRRGDLTQTFMKADITDRLTYQFYDGLVPEGPHFVYSDPPWNPGNEKYWRRHASASGTSGYDNFLDSWFEIVSLFVDCGGRHIFAEQSVIPKHRKMFIDAMDRSGLAVPLLNEYTVHYGSPGSASCRRPNTLFHFGDVPITTDPSGMHGEPMTIRVCAGIEDKPPGSTVIDPCIGKGMTSRMAHYFGWNCIGTELNPKRLSKTVGWLERQGYEVTESD